MSLEVTLKNMVLSLNKDESGLYNHVLQENIETVKKIGEENPGLKPLVEKVLRSLFHRLETNNAYIEKRKSDPSFNFKACILMDDYTGLKFLLRAEENPNVFVQGKTPLHWAALHSKKTALKIILMHPNADLECLTLSGKKAIQLASDAEIQQMLQ
ncbi:hypothetical protein [Criblamydia sequanensis]|uniref:Uncharacterized protein n=1 Tax=Candidatus Criblamydia sequanensis CRIB-18 TaxID=1437425 RepID=A0A090D0G8_9BACT|nr:hypothetical protein [Criblamydia sequanensis]CDR35032.1 hypothetical protein CSEC_2226 [Criblamydia sequanensis CRIB-18]